MTATVTIDGTLTPLSPTAVRELRQAHAHEQRSDTVAASYPHPATRARLETLQLATADRHGKITLTDLGRRVVATLEGAT